MTTPAKPAPKRRRPKGEGSIYPVAGGGYRGSLPYPDPITGETRRRWVSGRTKAEVGEELRKLREERDRGGALAGTPTLEAWAARWLRTARHTVRPSTFASYEWTVAKLGTLGPKRLGELRPSDVESWTGELIATGGLKPSTAQLARRILGNVLGAAVRDGLLVRNPVASSRPPKVEATERRSLTPAELRRLLEVAAADAELGPAVELLVATGLRRGELLGLRWSDYRPEDGTLEVRRALVRGSTGPELAEPKTPTSRRVVELPALGVAALERARAAQEAQRAKAGEWWAGGDDPLVVTTAAGEHVHPVAFGSAFRRLALAAGLEGVTPHTLRHTNASMILAAGVPARDAAEALGHSTRVLLRTYAHAMPGSRGKVARALDEALS
jgi:integrase